MAELMTKEQLLELAITKNNEQKDLLELANRMKEGYRACILCEDIYSKDDPESTCNCDNDE